MLELTLFLKLDSKFITISKYYFDNDQGNLSRLIFYIGYSSYDAGNYSPRLLKINDVEEVTNYCPYIYIIYSHMKTIAILLQ